MALLLCSQGKFLEQGAAWEVKLQGVAGSPEAPENELPGMHIGQMHPATPNLEWTAYPGGIVY